MTSQLLNPPAAPAQQQDRSNKMTYLEQRDRILQNLRDLLELNDKAGNTR